MRSSGLGSNSTSNYIEVKSKVDKVLSGSNTISLNSK